MTEKGTFCQCSVVNHWSWSPRCVSFFSDVENVLYVPVLVLYVPVLVREWCVSAGYQPIPRLCLYRAASVKGTFCIRFVVVFVCGFHAHCFK